MNRMAGDVARFANILGVFAFMQLQKVRHKVKLRKDKSFRQTVLSVMNRMTGDMASFANILGAFTFMQLAARSCDTPSSGKTE